jgi:hypothetical protein
MRKRKSWGCLSFDLRWDVMLIVTPPSLDHNQRNQYVNGYGDRVECLWRNVRFAILNVIMISQTMTLKTVYQLQLQLRQVLSSDLLLETQVELLESAAVIDRGSAGCSTGCSTEGRLGARQRIDRWNSLDSGDKGGFS